MAAAQKLRPAATQHASSPGGNPRLQSLFAAHESNGRHTSVLGASALERLAYRAPCAVCTCIDECAACSLYDVPHSDLVADQYAGMGGVVWHLSSINTQKAQGGHLHAEVWSSKQSSYHTESVPQVRNKPATKATRARLAAEGCHCEAEVVAEVRHPLPAALVVEQDLHHLATLILAARHAAYQVVRQEAALGVATCSVCEGKAGFTWRDSGPCPGERARAATRSARMVCVCICCCVISKWAIKMLRSAYISIIMVACPHKGNAALAGVLPGHIGG